jgi:hypothetical protein
MRPGNPFRGIPIPRKTTNKKGKQVEGKSYEKGSFDCIDGKCIRFRSRAAF